MINSCVFHRERIVYEMPYHDCTSDKSNFRYCPFIKIKTQRFCKFYKPNFIGLMLESVKGENSGKICEDFKMPKG